MSIDQGFTNKHILSATYQAEESGLAGNRQNFVDHIYIF
jgi:hypothetical protein